MMEDYVPDAPIAYDARYLDGSFEGNQGFGWDTCYTRTPGKITHPQTGGSEGSSYVTFESAACEGMCLPTNPSASHVYAWFSGAPSATAKMGLYFDVKNLGGTGAVHGRAALLRHRRGLRAGQRPRGDRSRPPADVVGLEHPLRDCHRPGRRQRDRHLGELRARTVGIDALRLGPPCHAGS